MNTNHYFAVRQMHPVWQFLLAVAAFGILGALAVFGLVLFLILAGVGLVAGSILYLRAWWIARKLDRKGGGPQTLEGEFIVVEKRRIDRE